MDDFDEIIEKLRKMVKERHEIGLRAIDELVTSLSGPALPSVRSGSGTNGSKKRKIVDKRTNVEKVLDAIKTKPQSAFEIAEATGLSEKEVRGALGGKPVAARIESRRINKKARYVLKEATKALDKMESAT